MRAPPCSHPWLPSLQEPTLSKDPSAHSSLVHLCCYVRSSSRFLCCSVWGYESKVQMGFTGEYKKSPVILGQVNEETFYGKLKYSPKMGGKGVSFL